MSARALIHRSAITDRAYAILPLVAFVCLVLVPAADGQPSQEEANRKEPGAFEFAPRAYIQLDWRGYPDWTVAPGTGRLEYNAFQVRRLRGGVDGQWRRLAFEVTLDPQDLDGTVVKDAYVDLRVTRTFHVRAGQFKLPGSREYGISGRNIAFLERSALASTIAAGRDVGLMVTGRHGAALVYQGGLFVGDGNGRTARAGRTSAGRLVWRPGSDLALGSSLSEGWTSSIDTDPANGFEGRSASGYRFFERVYVQGRRLRLGADVDWEPGPWRFSAEVLRARNERAEQGLEFEDLPGIVGVGWSVTATRQFGRRQGSARSRAREWNLGIRFDALAFDDEGPATTSDSVRPRATDVRPRSARTLTGSVWWRPTRWARVITNAALEQYGEPRSAPEPGRRGPYWTLGTRLQFELP